MDEWDEIDADGFSESTATATREVVPEGRHEFRIKSVTNGATRLEMELVHDDPRYFWVKCNPPKNADIFKKLAGSLAKALGMKAAELRDAIDAGDITGRRVAARIWHKPGDRGGTFANVGEFHATETSAAQAGEAKPAARRTPKQKADAAASNIPEDDIPF